jgi:hypothetical protein
VTQNAETMLVEVRRDDLAWALKYMTVDGAHIQAVKDRLAAALGNNGADVCYCGYEATKNDPCPQCGATAQYDGDGHP